MKPACHFLTVSAIAAIGAALAAQKPEAKRPAEPGRRGRTPQHRIYPCDGIGHPTRVG